MFKTAWLKNTGYNFTTNKNSDMYVISHKNSGAYVLLNHRNPKKISLAMGETPNAHRGKGIATKLRALATIFAAMSRTPITHQGVWRVAKRANNKNNRPPTTRIVRNKLGWNAVGNSKNKSIYKPKNRNNNSLRRAKQILEGN